MACQDSGLNKSKKVNTGQVKSGQNRKSELGQLKLDRSSQESFWTKISFQPLHFWETNWGLVRLLFRLYKLNKSTLIFTQSKSDLRYDQNREIIASHGIVLETSWGLDSQLIELVWLNKASIPNFSFLGSLEVHQIYLPGWGGWLYSDYNASLSSNWT